MEWAVSLSGWPFGDALVYELKQVCKVTSSLLAELAAELLQGYLGDEPFKLMWREGDFEHGRLAFNHGMWV